MDIIDNFVNFRSKWYSVVADYFVLLFWGIVFLWSGDYMGGWVPSYIKHAPETIKIIAFSALLILFFILTKYIFIRLIEKLKEGKNYVFRSEDWPSKWMYNGSSELVMKPSGLHIKSSRAGTLLKKYLWRDFEMSFDFEYAGHHMDYIGIVFRAQDLDNYFMLEINKKDKIGCIQRLVRYRGGWESSEVEEIGGVNWTIPVKVKLTAKYNLVKIKINDLTYEWMLPTHVDVNHFESGSPSRKNNEQKYEESKAVPEIPFRTSRGMVGFRAYPGQGAIIRNLEVLPM